jgi:predicted nucleotidyltransferase
MNNMLDPIAPLRSGLHALCRRYEVRRLELFGSAACGTFDPDTGDLDFLVAYQPPVQVPPDDHYLGLLADLEQLFGRKVDLVDIIAARNPYFIAGALKCRTPVFPA